MNRKLDQLFRDGNELFQRIFNSITEGVIVADANGKFLFFNNIAEEILGIGMQNREPGPIFMAVFIRIK
jgi:PAS domain-containing protein